HGEQPPLGAGTPRKPAQQDQSGHRSRLSLVDGQSCGLSRTIGISRRVFCAYSLYSGKMLAIWAQRGSRSSGDATRARAVNRRVPTCTPTLGSAWRFLNHAGSSSEPALEATTTKSSPDVP